MSDADSQTGDEDFLRTRSRSGGPENVTTIIGFDVTGGIPAGATIISATLNLYMFDTSRDDDPLNIHRVVVAWSEGSVTWSSHGWNSGGYDSVVEDTLLTGTPGWKVWEVASLVQKWVNGTETEYGFYLINNSGGAQHEVNYHSREYADPNFRPYLEITYLP